MRVLVCGDRYWSDSAVIYRELDKLQIDCIIEGGASGADAIAKKYAYDRRIILQEVQAEWSKYGNSAGPLRNLKMLQYYKPDIVLAFHSDLSKSKGTKDCVNKARFMHITVMVFVK